MPAGFRGLLLLTSLPLPVAQLPPLQPCWPPEVPPCLWLCALSPLPGRVSVDIPEPPPTPPPSLAQMSPSQEVRLTHSDCSALECQWHSRTPFSLPSFYFCSIYYLLTCSIICLSYLLCISIWWNVNSMKTAVFCPVPQCILWARNRACLNKVLIKRKIETSGRRKDQESQDSWEVQQDRNCWRLSPEWWPWQAPSL